MGYNINHSIRKVRVVCCALLCVKLSFPAYSSSPSPSYYYLKDGAKIAVLKKCGLGDEPVVSKTIGCILKNIPNQSKILKVQKENLEAFYRGMSIEPKIVSPEQCTEVFSEMKKRIESYDENCQNK
jgi:hypothetical protein